MATGRMSRVLQQLRQAVLLQEGGGLSDGELLGAFLAHREEAAFAALVRRHGPMVVGVCRRVLRDPHDAEDAFQATFLVLVRRAASVVPREQVGNWLYGVAYRTALEARRAAARRRTREKQVLDMPHPQEEPAEGWPELQSLLDQELSRLPDKQRLPVVLCDLEGRTRRDVARQLGLPESTLSNRLTAARKLLARRLTRHGIVLSGGAVATVLAETAARACPPATLVAATVKVATLVAAGPAAGAISAKVAALAEGVMKTMLLTKLKVIPAVLLALGLIGAVVGVHTPGVQAQKTAGPESEAVVPLAAEPEAQGTWQERARLLTQCGEGLALALSPDGKTLAVGGCWLGKVELWDLATRKVRTTIVGQPGQQQALVRSVAFAPDGKTLALAGWISSGQVTAHLPGWMKLYDVTTGRLLDVEHGHTNWVNRVAFAPDGKTLATGSQDFTVKLHDLATRKERLILPRHKSSITGLAYSRDGKLLAATSLDGTLRLWDAAADKEKALIDYTGTMFSSVALSPDGQLVAAGTWGQGFGPCDVYVFEVATGKERARLRGSESWVETVAFTPDGKTLAAAGGDKTVRLWDMATGQERAALTGHGNRILSVVFTGDSKTMISGGHEQTVRLWELKK